VIEKIDIRSQSINAWSQN